MHTSMLRAIGFTGVLLIAGCTSVGTTTDHDSLSSMKSSGSPNYAPKEHGLPLEAESNPDDGLASDVRPASLEEAVETDLPATAGGPVPPEKSRDIADGVGSDGVGFDDAAPEAYPVDLASVLALGGADNLQIQLVRERVQEAQLNLDKASLMWVPSLRAGIGYNRHDGRLQATEGEVIDAGRNSLFAGVGAGLGSASLAGGASGPARLVVDLSLADVWFEKLAQRQMFGAAVAAQDATYNDTLLAIAVAYFDRVEAGGLLVNAEAALAATDEMADLTEKFAEQGKLAPSEVARTDTQRGLRRRAVEDARRQTVVRNAELVRLLRLDPQMSLVPLEDRIAPVEFIEESVPLDELLSTGLANHPELRRHRHLVAAVGERVRQESWRPWLPHLAVGYGAGSFGGGPSETFENQSGRGDLDAAAVWELQHLGVGNIVSHQRQVSLQRQACFQYQIARDKVRAQIATALADVQSYRRQIDLAVDSVKAAASAYPLSLQRIRGGEGLPIELLQAIRARATAQDAYTKAVTSYNRAQFRLLRAIGQPSGLGEYSGAARVVSGKGAAP